MITALTGAALAAPIFAADAAAPVSPVDNHRDQRERGTSLAVDLGSYAIPRPVACDGDGTSGKRVQLVYAYGEGQTSRLQQIRGAFQSQAAETDDAFVEASRRFGGQVRHLRWVHDSSCRATVAEVRVPFASLNNWYDLNNELRARGHNRADRKYVVWGEANNNGDTGCAAIGGNDDRPGPENRNNTGPHYAQLGPNCWVGWDFVGHEFLHTVGAVHGSAPHAAGGGHCYDDEDIMCYGPEIQKICRGAHAFIIDCNGDDYFNTNPQPGNYLTNHWNIANSEFLIRGGASYGVGEVVTALGNKCLDVQNGRTVNGTVIQIRGCDGLNSQRWARVGNTLTALGKCLDVDGSGTANGTRIQLWDCNGSGAQVWEGVGTGTLRNPQSGRCVDVRYSDPADGTPVHLWDCHTGDNQRWRLPA
ncbi:RICIN domain-containing protein [Kibdelosporangium phytohabitans]|uniref:Ricin B lectin domain-containing protein n=1 Tax=Kibdelosporangium phytohabitans TaxID=860235 RepID=A0A0N9I6Z3_9PSEU|nr:RICIN domain-containing protein [Kibdelosporangium phytohabitans]ALG11938.1 hypothetical protein AOZ06_38250 [Kibdelosporangium phytohabitans]MBE1463392.1 hypothetical protein [Kibdelosporangium phytohabitans]